MLASSAENVLLWDIPLLKDKTESNLQLSRQWNNSNEQSSIITDIAWNCSKTTVLGVYNHYSPLFFASTAKNDQMVKTTTMVGQRCLALGARDKIIASAGQDNTIQVYHMTGSRQTSTISGHTSNVTTIQFNDSSSYIASGSVNGEIILTNMVYRDTSTPLLAPRVQAITKVCHCPQKSSLLGASSSDGAINIWEANRAKLLHSANQIHSASASSLAFFQDRNVLASVGLGGELALFDTTSFSTVSVTCMKSALTCVDVCGELVCVGSKQGGLYMYDRRSMKCALLSRPNAHKTAVASIKFRKHPDRFSSGSSFNLSTNMSSVPDIPAESVCVTPDSSVTSPPLKDQPDMAALGLFSPASTNTSFAQSDISCNPANMSDMSLLWPSFNETSLQTSHLPSDHTSPPLKDPGKATNTNSSASSFSLTSHHPQLHHSPFDLAKPRTQGVTDLNPSPQPQQITPVLSWESAAAVMNRKLKDSRDLIKPTSLAFAGPGVTSSNSAATTTTTPPPPSTTSSSSSLLPTPAYSSLPSSLTKKNISTPLLNVTPHTHSTPVTAVTAAAANTTATATTTAAPATATAIKATSIAAVPCDPSALPLPQAAAAAAGSVSFKLLRSVVYDTMEEFADHIHNDILCLQLNMLNIVQQQKVELLDSLQQQMSIVKDLVAENQQLRQENKQLRKNY
ncbi:protein NEDD1-like [Argonauta hians]